MYTDIQKLKTKILCLTSMKPASFFDLYISGNIRVLVLRTLHDTDLTQTLFFCSIVLELKIFVP